jgi:predicted  nucleic acid-binding Zn-ribbon protein
VSSVDVFASAISSALETVLRKVGEGKKLSTEDLVVLMLGLFQEIRKDITETNKRIDALYDLVGKNYEVLSRKIDETNKRIDAINDSLSKRIDALYELMGKNYEALNRRIEETNKRIDETNKRIDTLYDLLGKIYEVLIKGATTQRQ